MPLNVNESEDRQEQSPVVPPEPSAPTPLDGGGGGRRGVVLWIVLLAVVASGIFLAIQFGIIPTGNAPAPGVPAAGEPARVGSSVGDPGPQESTTPTGSAGERSTQGPAGKGIAGSGIPQAVSDGKYTIFISAFSLETDAGELAERWREAGYNAFIQHASGWYRVGLGRYQTVAVAREEAEKLRQAFEEGYWIGRAEL